MGGKGREGTCSLMPAVIRKTLPGEERGDVVAVLYKLTQMFPIVLVLNRSPPRLHEFVLLSISYPLSLFCSSAQDCFI